MAKFLLLLALGIVVYLIVSRARRQGERPAVPRQDSSDSSANNAGEDMVRCAVCRVHLPRSESITSKGEFFCSDEHRRLGVQGARKD